MAVLLWSIVFLVVPIFVNYLLVNHHVGSKPLRLLIAGAVPAIYVITTVTRKVHKRLKEQQAAERAQQAAERAQLQRLEEEQRTYRNQMVSLGKQSIDLLESIAKSLDAAEESLDRSEINFKERAFAPFWDSIENAARELAHFDEGVNHIKGNSSRYTELIGRYKGSPPKFPLARQSIAKLSVGTRTAARMQNIVRPAQRDFQFATIYEQRKTNQILVAGFTHLGDALNDMAWRVTDSIDGLVSSVDGMASTFDTSMRALHSRMDDIHQEFSREASEQTTREKKALDMLDAIQRRKAD